MPLACPCNSLAQDNVSKTVQEGMDQPPAATAHSPLPRRRLQTAAAAACRRCCRRRRGRSPRPLDRPAAQPVHPAAQAQVVKVTAYCFSPQPPGAARSTAASNISWL